MSCGYVHIATVYACIMDDYIRTYNMHRFLVNHHYRAASYQATMCVQVLRYMYKLEAIYILNTKCLV